MQKETFRDKIEERFGEKCNQIKQKITSAHFLSNSNPSFSAKKTVKTFRFWPFFSLFLEFTNRAKILSGIV